MASDYWYACEVVRLRDVLQTQYGYAESDVDSLDYKTLTALVRQEAEVEREFRLRLAREA